MPEEYHEARVNAQLLSDELMTAGEAAHDPACCTHRATNRALASPATNTAQSGAGAKRTDSITQTQEIVNS